MKKGNRLLSMIEKAKNGDQRYQSEIVNIYWEDIKKYIFYLTQNKESSEELTINTFTKVLAKLQLYNSDFNFKTWIISIAHNTVIDYLRIKKNYISEDVQLSTYEPSPEDILISHQSLEYLKKIIAKLSPTYQKVIELHYLEDKKLKEISEELQLSLPNVKVSLMRARKLLGELLKNQENQ